MLFVEISPSFAAAFLFVAALLAHGVILIHDGLYWDGWVTRAWQEQRAFAVHKKMARQIGRVLIYWVDRAIASLPAAGFCYKLFSFLALYLSALLVFNIGTLSGLFSGMEALWLALLVLCYPGQHMTVEPSCVISYVIPLPIYFLAWYLGLYADSLTGWSFWICLVCVFGLFSFCFYIQSLIIFYTGFILLLIARHLMSGGDLWHTLPIYLIAHGYFLALPFVFWMIKRRIEPEHGDYEKYWSIKMRFKGIRHLPKAYLQLLRTGAGGVYAHSLNHLVQGRYGRMLLGGILIVSTGLWVIGNRMVPMAMPKAISMLVAGLVLGCCASIPYILVGQQFGVRGWESKNNALLPLPMALIILGGGHLFFPLVVLNFMIPVLLSASIVYLNINYIQLQAVHAKNRSWMANLDEIGKIKSFSVLAVCDRHPTRFPSLGQPEHRPAYLSYMFWWQWGELNRLGINTPDPVTHSFDEDQLAEIMRATTIDFTLQQVDLKGKQGQIIVTAGPGYTSDVTTGLRYIYFRLFNRRQLQLFLKRLSRLEFYELGATAEKAA